MTADTSMLRAAPVMPGPAIGYPEIPGPRIPFLDACGTKGYICRVLRSRRPAVRPAYLPVQMGPEGLRDPPPAPGSGPSPRRPAALRPSALAPPGKAPGGVPVPDQPGPAGAAHVGRHVDLARRCDAGRMTCPVCEVWQPYCIPVSRGCCNDCDAAGNPPTHHQGGRVTDAFDDPWSAADAGAATAAELAADSITEHVTEWAEFRNADGSSAGFCRQRSPGGQQSGRPDGVRRPGPAGDRSGCCASQGPARYHGWVPRRAA